MSSSTTTDPVRTVEQQQLELASVSRVAALARETMFLPEVQRNGNENTLWSTMEGGIRMLSRRYGMSDLPIGHFEIEARSTWECFVLGASYTDADHPAQDRLVRVVLLAREYGLLTQCRRGGEGREEEAAVTESGGRIWTDLPFLVEVLREAWAEELERDHEEGGEGWKRWVNLTAGIARLASVGVKGEELGQCGLVIMAFALDMELDARVVKHLLGLVDVWLRYAGDNLLRLCLAGTVAWDAWGAGLISSDLLGDTFSRDRFLAWKNRLGGLKKGVEGREPDAVEVGCANMIDSIWDSFYGLH